MHIIFLIALLLFPLLFQFPFFFPFSGVLPRHIIQEGLLNPSPDVSEMLLEATTTNQGIYTYIMSFPQLAIRVPNLILAYYFESFPRLLYLHIYIYI